jgi:NAD-dependent DNA ligase
VLDLAERMSEAKEASPDSVDHMPPIRRARIDKEKEWKGLGARLKQITEKLSPTEHQNIQSRRLRLKSEIHSLEQPEIEERKARVIEHEKLNSQIESLVDWLKQAGVSIKVVRRDKTEKKHVQKGPPVLDVTTEIGPEAARSILAFFDSQAGKKILERLKGLGISPGGGKAASTSEGPPQAFAEKTFVLTGTLGSMTREEAAEEIRKRGGSVTNSVSKNTSFLIVGENAGATKSDQAKALGVQQITEDQFLAMLDLRAQPKSPQQQNLI